MPRCLEYESFAAMSESAHFRSEVAVGLEYANCFARLQAAAIVCTSR